MTVFAFTGHRPDKLGGYDDRTLQRLTDLVRAFIFDWQDKRPGEAPTFVTGMAQGWDTAVGLAAIELSIPFIAAVPFEGQELTWPEPAQERYRFILSKAKEVVSTPH